MKIAVPTAEGILSAHFGHCEKFTFVEIENNSVKTKTEKEPPPHEPGVLPAWLEEEGVNLIIAGGMGQRAQSLFKSKGIDVIVGAPSLSVEEIIDTYIKGTLKTGDNVCDH